MIVITYYRVLHERQWPFCLCISASQADPAAGIDRIRTGRGLTPIPLCRSKTNSVFCLFLAFSHIQLMANWSFSKAASCVSMEIWLDPNPKTQVHPHQKGPSESFFSFEHQDRCPRDRMQPSVRGDGERTMHDLQHGQEASLLGTALRGPRTNSHTEHICRQRRNGQKMEWFPHRPRGGDLRPIEGFAVHIRYVNTHHNTIYCCCQFIFYTNGAPFRWQKMTTKNLIAAAHLCQSISWVSGTIFPPIVLGEARSSPVDQWLGHMASGALLRSS